MAEKITVHINPDAGQGKGQDIQSQWWKAKKEELHAHVQPVVTAIRENQGYRSLDNLRYARLYQNKDFDSFVTQRVSDYFGRKISLNVIRSCCDSASAKIAKSKPRPMFLTFNGSYSLQRRAKNLTKYVDGMYDDGQVYHKGQKCFVDSCVFGTGVLKIYKENEKICFDRVFPEELAVDDVEGRDGCPRQMHQQKLVHRAVLLEKFPKFAVQINAAKPMKAEGKTYRTSADMILVTESWHLRSGVEAKDGVHALTIDGATLFCEQWNKDYFPFAFLRWSENLLGFFGDGLASELIGIQLEINQLMIRIKEAQELIAIPRVYLETGSQISKAHITDEIGGIVPYTGKPPVFQTPVGMNREVYEYLEYLVRKAYEMPGISQLSASSKKPAGLDSAVAIREYQDIETERFALVGLRYQQFYLDVAKIAIDLSRDLYEESGSLSVKVKGKSFIEKLKWKDVDLEDDKFVMAVFPTNLLPRSPEGQLQFAQELTQSGFIPKEYALSLLNFPDLQEFFNLQTASLDDISLCLNA